MSCDVHPFIYGLCHGALPQFCSFPIIIIIIVFFPTSHLIFLSSQLYKHRVNALIYILYIGIYFSI